MLGNDWQILLNIYRLYRLYFIWYIIKGNGKNQHCMLLFITSKKFYYTVEFLENFSWDGSSCELIDFINVIKDTKCKFIIYLTL